LHTGLKRAIAKYSTNKNGEIITTSDDAMLLVLALTAGILNFIPNFGLLIALIPAVFVVPDAGPHHCGYCCRSVIS